MVKPVFEPLQGFRRLPVKEMRRRARDNLSRLRSRRTVRDFSDEPVPMDVIEDCLRAAATAPSGANMQPWHFVVVTDPAVKEKIRRAAEREEKEFYARRAPREWLEALEPLGTDEHKPFLVQAPCLIAVFIQRHGRLPDGRRIKHYYATESVGLATGILVAALHHAGLASLTHTPSPMGFLNAILKRPDNERPFLLMVVGYPARDARVPKISKKRLEEYVTRI